MKYVVPTSTERKRRGMTDCRGGTTASSVASAPAEAGIVARVICGSNFGKEDSCCDVVGVVCMIRLRRLATGGDGTSQRDIPVSLELVDMLIATVLLHTHRDHPNFQWSVLSSGLIIRYWPVLSIELLNGRRVYTLQYYDS